MILTPQQQEEPREVLDLDAIIRARGSDPARPRALAPEGPIAIGVAIWKWFLALSIVAKIVVGALAIAGVMYFSRLLQRPQLSLAISRTYGFDAQRNTAGIGFAVPVIYGTHRTFGHIVQRYIATENDEEILYALHAISEGEIEKISDLEINDQPIVNFKNTQWDWRGGTAGQSVIPWFEETRQTYPVGVDLTAEGTTHTYTTIGTGLDAFVVKVRFPGGMKPANKVSIKVEQRVVGGVFAEVAVWEIAAEKQEPFARTFRWDKDDFPAPRTPRSPGTLANDAGIGTTAWSSPSNAGASDNTYASVTAAGTNPATTLTTQYLKATNFGFAVPSTATIIGIEVEVERAADYPELDGKVVDNAVRLVKGGAIQTTDRKGGELWGSGDAYRRYGGPADLWGDAWTPADVNAATFGVAISAKVTSGFNEDPETFIRTPAATTAKIDHVRIVVHTRLPGGASAQFEVKLTHTNTEKEPKPSVEWESIDEISYDTQRYPNVALLALRIQATDQLNGAPRVSALAKGRKVRRLTGGALSGVESWSDNPVECLIDLLTNTRYGLGGYVTDEDLLLSSFQTVKDYCDETVTSPVTEKRHLLDMVLDEQRPAFEWVEAMMNVCRAFLVETDGQWRLGRDHTDSVSQVFTDANIVQDSFSNAWVSLSEEYDQVETIFLDGGNGYKRESVKFPNAGTETKPKQIALYGITRASAALREAKYHMNAISALSRFIEFRAAIESISVEVGDVILVQHNVPQWGFGGRVRKVVVSNFDGSTFTITGDLPGLDTTKVADGGVVDVAWNANGGTVGEAVQIDLVSAKAPTEARVYAAKAGVNASYQVQYADASGGPWTTAATITPSEAGWNRVTWSGAGSHRWWRLRLSVTGNVVAAITELEFYNSSSNHVLTVDTDQLPTTNLPLYGMAVRHTDDTYEEKTSISSVGAPAVSAEGYPQQVVTISGVFTPTPVVRDSEWVFGLVNNVAKKFRVMSITLEEDLTRKLVAMEYDAAIYDAAGLVLPARSPSLLPNPEGFPNPVTGVKVRERVVLDTYGSPMSFLDVTWDPPAWTTGAGEYDHARVYLSVLQDADPHPGVLLASRYESGRNVRTMTLGPFSYAMAAQASTITVWVQSVSKGGIAQHMDQAVQRQITLARLWGNEGMVEHFRYVDQATGDDLDAKTWRLVRIGGTITVADGRAKFDTGAVTSNFFQVTAYKSLARGTYLKLRWEAKFKVSHGSGAFPWQFGAQQPVGAPGGDLFLIEKGTNDNTIKFSARQGGTVLTTDNVAVDPTADHVYVVEITSTKTVLYVDGKAKVTHAVSPATNMAAFMYMQTQAATARWWDIDYLVFVPAS